LLFYTTLFITSLILIVVVLWVCRLFAAFGQRAYKIRLPDADQGPTAHLTEGKYGKDKRLASKAWGRKPHATPANLARTHPAMAEKQAPWGWPGNENEVRENQPKTAPKSQPAPKPYKARRKRKIKTTGTWAIRKVGYGLSGQSYQPSQDARSTFALDKKKAKG